jgi:hypothetical protein
MKTFFLFICLALALPADARIVRLIANTRPQDGEIVVTNQIEIAAHEVAILMNHYGSQYTIEYAFPGLNRTFNMLSQGNYLARPPTVTGPAVITLRVTGASTEYAFCILEITPESFPPDKTIIIPEGASARVALECSTNLLEWTELSSNAYTNVPANKFFRIKAERLP